jgi:hypothetical protein
MKKHTTRILIGLLLCVFVGANLVLQAATTPLDEKIPEEKETLVRCAVTAKTPKLPPSKAWGMQEGEYSYKLWLPKGYHDDAKRRWPCVFIASPGGKANMGAMAEILKSGGYIVISLQESRNAVDKVCESNFVAAHDDAVARLRVAEGLKLATGLSGGSRASSMFVQFRKGFAGLFQQAAGFNAGPQTYIPKNNFTLVTSIGCKDNICFTEWRFHLSRIPRGVTFYPLLTNETHAWSSKATAEKAFLILECQTLSSISSSFDTRAAAKSWLPRHAAIIRKTSGLAEKILQAERTLQAASRQSLSDPALAALKTELAQWRRDPAASKELEANKNFWKMFNKELTPVRLKPFNAIAKPFEAFAKRNSGTEAAALSAMFATACAAQKN